MAGERKNKPKSAVDQDIIRELARLLDETGLTEIEFERDGQRVRVARQVQVVAAAAPRWRPATCPRHSSPMRRHPIRQSIPAS